MSLSAMTWAVEAPISRPTAKLALVCLADHADENGMCFPSQKALADRVGVTARALRDALAWLEENGFVTRSERRRKDGSRTSDSYQLPPEAYRKNFPTPRKETQGQAEDTSGLTTFEPPTEPVTTAVRANAFDDLQGKLFEAAGLSGPRVERNPGLIVLAPILGLIEAGYSLENDILPVIRSKAATGFKPRTWGYYVDAVRSTGDRRKAIASDPKPADRQIDWAGWCKAFFDSGTWKNTLGPRPGDPGCKAPPEIVEQARRAAERQTA